MNKLYHVFDSFIHESTSLPLASRLISLIFIFLFQFAVNPFYILYVESERLREVKRTNGPERGRGREGETEIERDRERSRGKGRERGVVESRDRA